MGQVAEFLKNIIIPYQDLGIDCNPNHTTLLDFV